MKANERKKQLSHQIRSRGRMTSRNLVRICDEPTTYRDGYRYPPIRSAQKEIPREKKLPKPREEMPLFFQSYDTLQKLDRSKQLPFNALWHEKDIVGTDPRAPLVKISPLVKPPRVIRSKNDKAEWANPAINLDDVKDPEMRKIILDYTYKTTGSQSTEEVWRNWKSIEPTLSDTVCENLSNLVPRKLKIVPNLPVGYKEAVKKWDFLQDRILVDDETLRRYYILVTIDAMSRSEFLV